MWQGWYWFSQRREAAGKGRKGERGSGEMEGTGWGEKGERLGL